MRKLFVILFLVASSTSTICGQAVSWGDNQPSGNRESVSTAPDHPARFALDDDRFTTWSLDSGSTTGWLEAFWATPRTLGSITVESRLPEGVRLQFFALEDNHWVPISGAVLQGPITGPTTLNLPGGLVQETRVLVTLEGPRADQASVGSISFQESFQRVPFGKILPKSYSLNQEEFINLKASRLWDGIAGNTWFEPLWSFPWEVFQTDAENKPTKIFPPYYGNPPKNAEIIWELDGTYKVQTLKANFLQGSRSVQLDFWDGKKWVNPQAFGTNWADGASGWKRIDLINPVATSRIRITFPAGWERARYIGELEVWGTGWRDSMARSLVVSDATTDGTRLFTIEDLIPQEIPLEILVDGLKTDLLTGDWNGSAFQIQPTTWINNQTVYRTTISKDRIRPGTQFLRLQHAESVRNVILQADTQPGRVDLGWPYSDGIFHHTNVSPLGPVPSWKTKKLLLGSEYALEHIRIYSNTSSSIVLKTGLTNKKGTIDWTTHAWKTQDIGWKEVSLLGVLADQISFEASDNVVVDEIEVSGTRLKDTKVGLEIWWPLGPVVTSGANDGNSVIGWIGDPSVQPLLGGFHPRQSDKLFWMPLSQMNMLPDEDWLLPFQGVLGEARDEGSLRVKWSKTPPGTFDQGEALVNTLANTLVLSGSIKDSKSRVFVDGEEVTALAGKFTTTKALVPGFQTALVEIWDKNKKKRLLSWTKEIYRSTGTPNLKMDLPYGDLMTQAGSYLLSGRTGNAVGLTAKVNGKAQTLNSNLFELPVSLSAGTQHFVISLQDSLGQTTTQDLMIGQDLDPPHIQIEQPLQGQYLQSSRFELKVSAGNDPGLWWKINNEPWEFDATKGHSKSYTLADGFYQYSVTAQDQSGNVSTTQSVDFVIDPTPPKEFSIVADVTGWTSNNTPIISFATTDATSGIDHYEVNIDGQEWQKTTSPMKLPILSDGIHQVFVKAIDKAGNSTLATIEFEIDITAPQAFTPTVNVSGWTANNRPEVSFFTSDDTSGVSRYEVKIDQGGWIAQTSPYQVPTLADGSHSIEVRAFDKALNVTVGPVITVFTDVAPPHAFVPVVNVTGWTSNNRPIVEFSTGDDTSGIAHFEINIDDQSWGVQASPYQVPTLSDGAHNIGVRAIDRAGNITGRTVSVAIDTTPPLAVTELRMIPGKDRLDALWTTSDSDVVLYHLVRNEGGISNTIDRTTPDYSEAALAPGTVVQIQVQPEDRAGNLGPWVVADAAVAGIAVKAVDSQALEATLVEFEGVKMVVSPTSLPPEVKAVLINEIESPELTEKSINPIVGPIYSFSTLQDDGTGNLAETSHTEFPKEVLVTLDYDDSLVPNGFPESNLGVYYYDTLWSQWFRVEKAAIDIEKNKIVFLTNHFTNFSVQPTMLEDLKPQELKDAGHSPFKSESRVGEVTISPQGGTMMTEATEFVLQGKNGFSYPIKRIYDTQTARIDSPSINLSMSLGINFGDGFSAASIVSQLITGGVNLGEGLLLSKLEGMFQKNGDYPYALGIGWRLNVPYVRASDTTVLVRLPTGGYYPINQMEMKGEAPLVSGMRTLTFENHRGEDFTFTVHQIRGDVSGVLGNLSGEKRQELNASILESLGVSSGGGGGNLSISMLGNLIPGWATVASELVTKDGTSYAFDGFGRIISITDPARANVVRFDYKGFVLAKITDPLGNQTTFEYDDGATSGVLMRPSITKIHTPGPEGTTRTSLFEYETEDGMSSVFLTLPAMKSAVDVGGRKTTYGIDKRFLFSGGGSAKINFLQTLLDFIPGVSTVKSLLGAYSLTISGHVNLEWPRLINRIEAPGLGITEVGYTNKDLSQFDARPADFFMGVSWLPTALKLSYEFLFRIITDSVTFHNGSLAKSTHYDYRFTTRDSQWIVDQTIISDGLTRVTQGYSLYSRQYNRFVSFDDAVISALKQGVFTETSNVETEWYPLATSTRTEKLAANGNLEANALYESLTTNWDVDHSRPLTQITERGVKYRKTIEYAYDNWGNEIRVATTMQTPQATTSLLKESWFAGTNSSAPSELPVGVPSTPSQTIAGTKSLLLATKTTSSRPSPQFSSAEVTFQAFAYDSFSRPVWQGLWASDHWAASSRSYYPVTSNHDRLSGQLKETVSPVGQKTALTYDFVTLRDQNLWTETKTYLDVIDPWGVKNSQVEETAYDWGTSWSRKQKSAEGFITETRYDALGRPIDIVKPGREVTSPVGHWMTPRDQAPWDRIVYDDLALTTTLFKDSLSGNSWIPRVSLPSEFYEYDSRSNLVKISKYDRSSLAPQISVTKATYDAYNRVESMVDPNGQTTSYSYDFLSRPLTVTYADTTSQSFSYTDALGRKETTNERAKVTREFLNWGGQVEIVVADVGGLELTTSTHYDGQGRTSVVIDPLNQVTVTTYSVFGQPSLVQHPEVVVSESPVTLQTTLPVLNKKTVLPLDRLTYDDEGRLKTKQTGYEGHWRTSTTVYDGRGRAIAQNDEGRETWSWTDGSGRVVRQADPDQVSLLKAAQPGIPLESVGAHFTSTIYTSRGQVAKQTDPLGAVVSYEYDRDDHKILMRDPRAIGTRTEDFSVHYQYNELGRLVLADLPPVSGQPRGSVKFVYDLRGNATNQTDADGRVTTWTYDKRNRKTSQTITGTDGKALVTAWGYDQAGNSTHEITVRVLAANPADSLGLKTVKTYDGVNRITDVYMADGQESHTEFDALGRVVRTWNAQGDTTSYLYNSLNKVIKKTEPENKITRTDYDVWGNPTGTALEGGLSGTQLWVRGFEAHGQVSYEQNNADQSWSYTYNLRGLTTEVNDPRGTKTSTLYSLTGLPLNRIMTNGSKTETQSWNYDLAGALMGASDGSVSTLINQASGLYRPDPYDLITSYTTSVQGKTTTVKTDYDIGQRPTKLTYPDSVSINSHYNGLGQLTSIDDYASDGQYNYMGRLVSLSAANSTGRTKSWNPETGSLTQIEWLGTGKAPRDLTWDSRGNLFTQTKNDPSRKSQYYYDGLSRVVYAQEADPVEVNSKDSTGTRYGTMLRDVGGRKGLNYGHSSETFKLDYYSSSIGVDLGSKQSINKVRLTAVSDRITPRTVELYVSDTGLDGNWALIAGTTLVPDQHGTTIQLSQSQGGQYLKLHMTWDERDENYSPIDASTIQGTPAQLIQVWTTKNGQTTSWTYDALGNRVSQNRDGVAASTYYPNSNRLKTQEINRSLSTSWAFNYDANGNMISRGTSGTWNASLAKFDWSPKSGELWRYSYDLANRLTKVEYAASNGTEGLTEVASYFYDIRGLKVAQTKKHESSYFQYDQSGDLIWSDDGTTSTKFIHALGQVWAEVRHANGVSLTFFHSTDHEGTTNVITDQDGKIVWDGDYEAFGSVVRTNGTLDFTPSYTGKQYDTDTGLYYYNARFYDPTLGRFISEDPARSGDNWEIYASANPTSRIDPSGLADLVAQESFSDTRNNHGKPIYEYKYSQTNPMDQFLVDATNVPFIGSVFEPFLKASTENYDKTVGGGNPTIHLDKEPRLNAWYASMNENRAPDYINSILDSLDKVTDIGGPLKVYGKLSGLLDTVITGSKLVADLRKTQRQTLERAVERSGLLKDSNPALLKRVVPLAEAGMAKLLSDGTVNVGDNGDGTFFLDGTRSKAYQSFKSGIQDLMVSLRSLPGDSAQATMLASEGAQLKSK